MFLITLAQYLQGIRTGVLLVSKFIEDVRAGRAKVTAEGSEDETAYTPERLEEMGNRVLAHRDSTASDIIGDILADANAEDE